MNKRLTLVIFLFLAALSVRAQAVLNIKFDNNNFAGYFERSGKGVALGESPDGKKCLVIDGAVGSLTLKPVPVEPLQKYKLTIRAAIGGKDTIENNDRIPEFTVRNGGRNFSSYAVTFLDKQGQTTGFKLRGTRLVDNSGVIISSKVNDFVHVFYSPPEVAKMQLDLKTQKNTLFIESVKLEVENAEGTINCNPDFRYGELNPSGWGIHVEGRLYRRPDGKTILNSGTSTSSSSFPVNDKSRYSFYCKGTGYDARREKGKTMVAFYDDKGGRLAATHLFWDYDMKDGNTKKSLQPPPDSVRANVIAYRMLLEELRVTKDK